MNKDELIKRLVKDIEVFAKDNKLRIRDAYFEMAKDFIVISAYVANLKKLYKNFYFHSEEFKRLKYKESMSLFMTYTKIASLSEPFEDIFTSLFEECNDTSLGQFFTPSDVSKLVSSLMAAVENSKSYEIHEPTCGTGSLILAVLQDRNNESHCISVDMNDIDITVATIAYCSIFSNSVIHRKRLKSLIVKCDNALLPKFISNPNIVFAVN